jgi:putative membrane protein
VKQLQLMTERLWFIITWPSAVLAILFAVWPLIPMPGRLQQPWMHVKLGFVVLLMGYEAHRGENVR